MRSFIRNLRHEDHKKALVATLVFIFLMMLFFLLVSLEYPDPPPQEKIVEVEIEFGSEYEGGGQVKPVDEVIPKPQPESATEKAVQEESPVVVTTAKGKSNTSKNTTTTKTNPDPKPDPDPKPKVDDAFTFPGSGTTGDGKGDGPGFGDGTGVGGGGEGDEKGTAKTNTSRKLKSKGRIPGSSQEEGLIALDLYVDETGKVVRTKRNESKSTSGSAYLTDLAKKNAATYKYEAIPGAPVQFVGTVIFNFRKQ